MSVACIVPWRTGCPYRERAWEWCRQRLPWPVIEAPGPDPWCKALAVNPVIERCSADVVIVADSDVACSGIGAAVAAVENGEPWAMPHGKVYRLSEESTSEVLAGTEPHTKMPLDQAAYQGVWGGGIVVAPREVMLSVPLDARFVGWG